MLNYCKKWHARGHELTELCETCRRNLAAGPDDEDYAAEQVISERSWNAREAEQAAEPGAERRIKLVSGLTFGQCSDDLHYYYRSIIRTYYLAGVQLAFCYY